MKDVRTRRGADSFRSPSGCGQDETESKETLNSWEDSSTKVQYSFPTRQDSREEKQKTAINNSRTRAEKVKARAEYT
ncbi:unnamed protein product [Schistosoma margrebowiei]|uniref:Uncharacterized protein n=1 Tax=Schistosoma margrebowiei TaxID=48269 RepID=A0A183M4D8_9TREM|nr:unnamed protein product [Schistosoma margrebowiei]